MGLKFEISKFYTIHLNLLNYCTKKWFASKTRFDEIELVIAFSISWSCCFLERVIRIFSDITGGCNSYGFWGTWRRSIDKRREVIFYKNGMKLKAPRRVIINGLIPMSWFWIEVGDEFFEVGVVGGLVIWERERGSWLEWVFGMALIPWKR